MTTQQFKTCIFKLRTPSKNKRQVLDYVFEQYTLGMADLFDFAHQNIDLLQDKGQLKNKDGQPTGKYTEKSIKSHLPSSGDIQYPIAGCLKEHLLTSVAANLASFFSKAQAEKTGFPTARDPSPEGWPNALANFGLVGGDLEDEKESKDKLLKRARGSVMPILFNRSRDFTLLVDRQHEKFFVRLPLLPKKHSLSQKRVVDQGELADMETGEVFNKRSYSEILFPLDLGRRNGDWHWQYYFFLLPLLDNQIKPKSAKLVRKETRKGVDYYLHVSFAFECPEPYQPETYLGGDSGVLITMAYGLVDNEGRIIEMGHNKDGFRDERIAAGKRVQAKQAKGKRVTYKDYRQKHLDSILHVTVNNMIDLALKHKAMIVLEDLNILIGGKFYKSAWKKLHKFMAYKCKLAGVPIWSGGVFAAYSSQICIYCGELNPHRKRDGSPFTCLNCGAQYHSDEGAGVNIARRALYRKKDWKESGGYRAFHRSFANGRRFEAKNDLRKEGVPVT